jgi:hypothetical protein
LLGFTRSLRDLIDIRRLAWLCSPIKTRARWKDSEPVPELQVIAHRQTPHFKDLVLDQIAPRLQRRMIEEFDVPAS